MTDASNLDIREQIARIDRSIGEIAKLQEEARKYSAEQHKLTAETAKLDREYRWFPWLQLATSGAIAAVIAAIVAHWK